MELVILILRSAPRPGGRRGAAAGAVRGIGGAAVAENRHAASLNVVQRELPS